MLYVCSLNIRRRKIKDLFHHWLFRKKQLVNRVLEIKPDIICFQEVDKKQLKYLIKNLSTVYNYYCPEDNSDGLYQPIFYLNNLLIKDKKICWLNKNKTKNETSWDEKYPRLSTYIHIIKDNKDYLISNIHFDHKGNIARTNQAKIIYNELKNYSKNNKLIKPTEIFIGDFNETFGGNAWKYFNSKCSTTTQITKTYYPGFNTEEGYKIDFAFYTNSKHISEFTDIQNTKYPYSDHTIIGLIL